MHSGDSQNDGGREPTSEEIEQMRQATLDEAAAVDALILRYCTQQWHKVAMVVGQSLNEFEAKFRHLPFIYMQVRMLELQDSGRIEIRGDVMSMRTSEVRLTAR